MSVTRTQLSAVIACYYMHRWSYQPKSVINVGVGSAPELKIWRWLLPDAQLVGIDTRLRHGRWDAPYIQAAAASESGKAVSYCRHCRSVKCDLPEHGNRYIAKSITIDEVAASLPGPYFLWLDCEGSELDALKGARETLKRTQFVSLEVRNFAWTENNKDDLHTFLGLNGFRLLFKNSDLDDRLYHRKKGTV